jgi:membrane-associated phospholipid phosphatase
MDTALDDLARQRRCSEAARAVRAAARATIVAILWRSDVADVERARRPVGRGGRVGTRAARRTLRRIARDRLNPDVMMAIPTGPERWEPAAPDFMGPTDISAPSWRPWNLRDVRRLRPPAPPTGEALIEQAREVWRISRALTPQQRASAVFWAGGAGTVTPPGHWLRIARDVLAGRGGGRLAHDLATVATAQADAFIACWDAKYAYWLARPVTLIQRFDPAWTATLPNPPFPAYVSGHAATSAAAAAVIGALAPARRDEVWGLAEEAARSRVEAGIHFPVDSVEGMRLGRRAASAALARRLSDLAG